ncbi:MAG: phosphoglucosamine mutase [Bacillota bacterium]|nr:phosphoglucosamine mutase [Bacillota bacterium]MDW7684527.1 phosphoglucosamine mutase [Bacillota bacterium]
MGKLFGTDGIRGVANRELTPELVFKIGRIGAHVLSQNSEEIKAFLVARDTRISGPMLEAALIAGLTSTGADVYVAGVISTPAAAYLTKQLKGCGGVMISASHNAYPDNGIKFFNAKGFKLADEVEAEIEDLYFSLDDTLPRPEADKVGRVYQDETAEDRYLDYLLSTVPSPFKGLRVVLDCANGASFRLAPKAFRALGADVFTMHYAPDGININNNCGSTHPEPVMQAVRERGADLGFTFDGDADRVLAVDENGQLVDGDAIMTVLAQALKDKGQLRNDTVVATVMSNLGLEKAAEAGQFRLLRTKVGDRYVLEEMLAGNHSLGGEQSGHIILLDYNTTGDGILTALQVMAVLAEKKQTLSSLASSFTRYPQVLVNCHVGRRDGWDTNPRILAAISECEEELSGKGRLLVRPSGTEPLIRVMMEGQNEDELHIMANRLADVIKEELA